MDARELRIGNWIVLDMYGVAIPSVIDSHLDFADTSDYKPIPLTEEWLLKFGFEEYQTNYYQKKYKPDFISIKDELFCVYLNSHCDLITDEYGESRFNKFHYVHQLQNLYFALTGEELTTK